MSDPTPTAQQTRLPPLNSLIRPAHILSLFRHHEQRKTHHFDGCSQLWNAILTHPQDSPAHRQAYRQLTSLTQTIKDAMARQKATERETARHAERSRQERLLVLQRQRQRVAREQSAFRTLVRQVAGAVPVPGVADFEAGLSAFHPEAAVGSGLDARDAERVGDDVETALGLLDVSTERASEEDVYAGLTLLGVRMCVRVEEYLRSMSREGE